MIAMLPEDQTFLFINKDNDTMTVDAKWSVHLMNLDIWPRMLTSVMHLLNLVCEEVKMCWEFKDVAPSDMAHPSPIYVVVSADFNNDGYKEQLQQYRTVATTFVRWVDFSIPSYPSHVGNQIDSVLFSAKCPLSFKPVGLFQSNGDLSWVVKSQEKCTLFDCWLVFKACLCGFVF